MPDSVLEIAHHTAPVLVVAFDMLLAAPLSIWYGGAAGSWEQSGYLHIPYYNSTRTFGSVFAHPVQAVYMALQLN